MVQFAIRCQPRVPVSASELERWLKQQVSHLRDQAPHGTIRLSRLTQGLPSAIGWLVELELADGEPLLAGDHLADALRDMRLLGLQPTLLAPTSRDEEQAPRSPLAARCSGQRGATVTTPSQSLADPAAAAPDGETAVPGSGLASGGHTPDVESPDWLRALSSTGRERDEAVERLHALLLRAARFEVARRRVGPLGGSGDLDDLAIQAADDALVAVLNKLHTYRGDSRFTTWAYKFALLEADAKLRKRPWQGREVPLETNGIARLRDEKRASPAAQAEASELLHAVGDAIAEVLTAHQRAVLIAITLNDVPIDVLAERRGTTRGALYKTLHDARRKLRAALTQQGIQTT